MSDSYSTYSSYLNSKLCCNKTIFVGITGADGATGYTGYTGYTG